MIPFYVRNVANNEMLEIAKSLVSNNQMLEIVFPL